MPRPDANTSFIGQPFANDVFISYSHGDVDQTGDSDFAKWAQLFHEELRRAILPFTDEMKHLRVFFDASRRPDAGLKPGDAINSELEENAKASAFLIALISPFYLRSAYCTLERQWWHEGQEALAFETRDRFFPVLIWGSPPPPCTSWEEALRQHHLHHVVHERFFDPSRARTHPHPFGWPGIERNQQMINAVLGVVGHLFQRLETFREQVRQRQALQPVAPNNVRHVYLHAGPEDAGLFDQAFEQLVAANLTVVPDMPEPRIIDPAARQTERTRRLDRLARSDVLVLVAPEDSDRFLEELCVWKAERNTAIARAEAAGQIGRRLPVAVLDPVADPVRARRRAANVRNLDFRWFHLADPDWTGPFGNWLREAQ